MASVLILTLNLSLQHATPCFSISDHPSLELTLWTLVGPWYFQGYVFEELLFFGISKNIYIYYQRTYCFR